MATAGITIITIQIWNPTKREKSLRFRKKRKKNWKKLKTKKPWKKWNKCLFSCKYFARESARTSIWSCCDYFFVIVWLTVFFPLCSRYDANIIALSAFLFFFLCISSRLFASLILKINGKNRKTKNRKFFVTLTQPQLSTPTVNLFEFWIVYHS